MEWMVVSGFAHIVWKSVSKSKCRVASMGSSPRRKYRAGMGELELSFMNPRNTL